MTESHPSNDALTAYALGRLDETKSASIEAHLENCESCERVVEEVPLDDDFCVAFRGGYGALEELARNPAGVSPLFPGVVSLPVSHTTEFEELRGILSKHGKYQVKGELGKGGMGIVIRAYDEDLDRDVAIKTIRFDRLGDSRAVARFQREMKFARLKHRGIVTIYDTFPIDEYQLVVMEFVDGKSLDRAVEEEGVFGFEEVCRCGCQIAGALHYAAQEHVVHRDIKPQNIMRVRGGEFKLLDFGIARRMDQPSGATQEVRLLGTPGYMAPEQVTNPASVDERADIYSLGCTLYFLLTGKSPRQGNSDAAETVVKASRPPSIRQVRPEVPDDLEALVYRMMAYDPEQRFPNGEAVVNELSAILDRLDSADKAKSDATKLRSRQTKRSRSYPRVRILTTGVVAISLVVVSVLVIYRDRNGSAGNVVLPNRLDTSVRTSNLELNQAKWRGAMPIDHPQWSQEGTPLGSLGKIRFPGQGNAYSQQINRAGSEIVTTSQIGPVRLIDAVSGRTLDMSFSGQGKMVTYATFSGDGKWVASGSYDHHARVYDRQTGFVVKDIPLGDLAGGIKFSPDDSMVAISPATGSGSLISTQTWTTVGELPGKYVADIWFSRDGSRIYYTDDHKVCVMDRKTENVKSADLRIGNLWSMDVRADEKWMAVGTNKGTVAIIDPVALKAVTTVASGKPVFTVKFVRDRLVVSREDGKISVFDAANVVSGERLLLVKEYKVGGTAKVSVANEDSAVFTVLANRGANNADIVAFPVP